MNKNSEILFRNYPLNNLKCIQRLKCYERKISSSKKKKRNTKSKLTSIDKRLQTDQN